MRSSENTTSSASIADPSWNLTPLRMVKVKTKPSSETVQLSAT